MGSQIQYSAEIMRSSLVKIRILVVDDDLTALFVVTEVLKKWDYEVTGVKNPLDAMSTLRTRRGMFDLIVTDYHMPIMNGLELQQCIHEEFNLPVILMSGDNNECLMLKSLECGAAYFILKPVKPIDCKNIWQYAVARTKPSTKSIATAVHQYFPTAKSTKMNFGRATVNNPPAASSMASMAAVVNENEAPIINPQAPPPINGTVRTNVPSKPIKAKENAVKKPKVAWTNFLHNQFLQAVNFIGIEKAVPKKILELMNIPGLTRQNIASHLQKYRIFLKRVAEKGKENQLKALGDVLAQNPNPSLITMPHPPSMMTVTRGGFPHFQMNRALLSSSSSSQDGLQWGSSIPKECSIGTNVFPSEVAAPTTQARFNQQMVLGTANIVAISRPDIPSSRVDLLNNNQGISQYSAASDITALTSSKPIFQDQSRGAILGLLSPTISDGNSGKPDSGLGNHQGSYGTVIRFLGSSCPLDPGSNNPNFITNHQQSLGGVATNEVQLNNIGMDQVPNSIEGYGLLTGPMCENQGECEENNVYDPTGSPSGLTDSIQTPKLKNGDLFDVLLDYFPNLRNGGEEIMQTTPFSNRSNDHADPQVGAMISNDAAQDQEGALWDYEELQLPVPPVHDEVHQQEQTVPGSDASLDKDWDELDFIESLLATVSPSPARD